MSLAPAPLRHDNNFNLLRLLFALAVILSHSTELAGGHKNEELLYHAFHTATLGELAVDGFFLLSGYLIVQSWLSRPQIWTFLKKRILRIYPAFIVASLVCVFIVGPLGAASTSAYYADLSLLKVLKNIGWLLQPESPPVFQGQSHPTLNEAMWTISYEFKCYMAVLVLGLVGVLKFRSVWLLLTLALLTVVASQRFGFALPAPKALVDWASLRGPTFRFASFFFAGGCFYLYREHIRYHGKLALAAAAVLVATMVTSQAALLEVELPILGGYVLFYLGFKPIAAVADFGRRADISYGVYLYGWPVQKLLLWYFPGMSPWLLFPLACAAAMALGWISWHAIEGPCLRMKNSRWLGAKPAPLDPVAGTERA